MIFSNWMVRFSWALISTFLILCGCAEIEPQVTPNVGRFAHIALPDDVKIESDPTRRPDFYLYALTRSDRQIMGIYFGSAPQVLDKKFERTIRIGGCDAHLSERRDGKNSVDVVLPVRSKDGFPQYFHFWAGGLSEADTQKSLDILTSGFRLANGLRCGVMASRYQG